MNLKQTDKTPEMLSFRLYYPQKFDQSLTLVVS
jgi:hypothetical protein